MTNKDILLHFMDNDYSEFMATLFGPKMFSRFSSWQYLRDFAEEGDIIGFRTYMPTYALDYFPEFEYLFPDWEIHGS